MVCLPTLPRPLDLVSIFFERPFAHQPFAWPELSPGVLLGYFGQRRPNTNAVLCIAKLDRLARNVAFISQLMDSGVEFVACDNPHANRMTIQIMAVMAEQEARFIQERTVAGLAALKQRGVTKTGKPVRLGNPNNGTPEQTKRMHDGAKARADAYAQSIIGEIRKWQAKGISTYKDLADILTGKFPTPRGAEVWQATQVKRIIERVQGAIV